MHFTQIHLSTVHIKIRISSKVKLITIINQIIIKELIETYIVSTIE